ncbi:2-amino-4-hydroxy-6-hydroxymethyldihydropteridine diphosphokinase [Sphingorhabdus pulchriflava]|uniref:2-amino-4-hydroxy-6-hydroxymethyldihydropteridine pyrophosphokinase n=1 Tax=Sphingorhabdus pulchriflava TaxID=2292257 RepID=A0A371BGK0_9SPHN|nr:2-amino-4-hydroxy-6-hydroxymethyldihydropteridine diphosphokinase [Sphingorhabdus pulchriflava]RDV06627.1 2-amino-4-hydroxy-6-hydroxymethyldihydropteridine diphosphokinase [Sphingorhabdus pulchriflava]
MTGKSSHLYLIALGSNQRHELAGSPQKIIEQAIEALEMRDIDVFAQSSVIESAAMGSSRRRYANAVAVIASDLDPPALLRRLHSIEIHFGRRRNGQRWRARTLDLDILLWSGGIWSGERPALGIPHAAMRDRNFVLGPATEIAPDWRDPLTGLTIRQLFHRLNRPKPLDRWQSPH